MCTQGEVIAMKIFISGASGFVGRAVTTELAKRGHEVVGLVRDKNRADIVKRAGGRPVVGDLLENGSWCNDIKASDRVISLTQPFKLGDDIPLDKMEDFGHKHAEAVTNLIKAAAEGMAKSIIVTYHSLCYGDRKGKWVADADAVDPIGYCRPLTGSIKAIDEIGEESEIPIVRMFPALVYGNGGWFKRLIENFQNGTAKIVEPGSNFLSLIHVEDLAGMYANAVEKLRENETLTLSDNRPVVQSTLMEHIADLLDLPVPALVDFNTYAREFGLMEAETMSCSTRVPGIHAMDVLNYVPKHRSYEAGIRYTLCQMGIEPRKRELEEAA
jgi:nucleoside-diphosphate-sugar epimerase